LNFGKTFKIFIVMMLCIGSSLAIINTTQLAKSLSTKAALPTDWPLVYFTNGTANSYNETFIGDVNDTITIALVVTNLTDNTWANPNNTQDIHPLGNVDGFDVQMLWNPEILQLINYTVTTPVEDYPNATTCFPSPYGGILHGDPFELANKVDENDNIPNSEEGTMAWFSYSLVGIEMELFNGNGTFCTLTFKVIDYGSCLLKLTNTENIMSGDVGKFMPVSVKCHTFDGAFRTAGAPVANFTFWPNVGVIDKPVIFNASASYSPFGVIANYTWNFGDGKNATVTDPIINHNYTAAKKYTITLTVMDSEGVGSSPETEQVTIVNKRNLKVVEVTPSQTLIQVNDTINIGVRVENDGGITEDSTIVVYYNASSIDWADIPATNWTKADETNVTVTLGSSATKTLHWNTTGVPQPDGIYYILANVTAVPYENVSDNSMISVAINMSSKAIDDIAVDKLQFGWSVAFKSPVLKGENVTFQITVLNKGTEDETAVNVTLYYGETMLKSWVQSILRGRTAQLSITTKPFDPGSYNITAQATIENDTHPDNNFLKGTLLVIETPNLNFTMDPTEPRLNQTVTLDASATYHPGFGASIIQYKWQIYNPAGTLVNTTYGANVTSIIHKFGEVGRWRVVLSVKDNYNIEYSPFRPKTSAYQIEAAFNVQISEGGFPIEYIAAIIIVIVAVVVILAILIRRRRHVAKT
jgi:hypothetical protein